MIAAIIAGLTVLGQVLSLIGRIMDANKEKDEALKKQKTEALQSGVRAIVDKDVSRLSASINDLNKLRK